MLNILFSLGFLIATGLSQGTQSSDIQQLINFNIQTENDAQVFQQYSSDHKLDIWTKLPNNTIQARVGTRAANELRSKLSTPYTVVHSDLNRLVAEELKSAPIAYNSGANPFHTAFHTTKEIYQFMDQLVSKYSSLVHPFEFGKTYRGQSMRGVKISTGGNANKKAWIIHGGIHSREWITISTVVYLMDELITKSNNSPQIQSLLNNFDVYLIPVVNVDGYDYTRTERFWRKNLQPIPNSQCFGIDLNRNWGFEWSNQGKDPCEEDYPGPSQFSAPETSNLAKYISNIPEKSVYIDVHAFGQMWMYPYGYKCDEAETSSELYQMSQAATQAMVREGAPQFKFGSICKTIYPAKGSSVDWGYSVAKIPYPFAVELKDLGQNGFVQPPSAIIPQGREFVAAILAIGDWLTNNQQPTEQNPTEQEPYEYW